MKQYKNMDELLNAYGDPKNKMTKATFFAEVAKLNEAQAEEEVVTEEPVDVRSEEDKLIEGFKAKLLESMSVHGYRKHGDDDFTLYTVAVAGAGYENMEDSGEEFANLTASEYYPNIVHDELRGNFFGSSRFELYRGKLVETIAAEVFYKDCDDDAGIVGKMIDTVYKTVMRVSTSALDGLGSGRMIFASETFAIMCWFDEEFILEAKKFKTALTDLKSGYNCERKPFGVCMHTFCF